VPPLPACLIESLWIEFAAPIAAEDRPQVDTSPRGGPGGCRLSGPDGGARAVDADQAAPRSADTPGGSRLTRATTPPDRLAGDRSRIRNGEPPWH
jgi:hypothetical protein